MASGSRTPGIPGDAAPNSATAHTDHRAAYRAAEQANELLNCRFVAADHHNDRDQTQPPV